MYFCIASFIQYNTKLSLDPNNNSVLGVIRIKKDVCLDTS